MSDIKPYGTLGKHLRYLREQHLESLAEVSGAVEIDQQQLERIEAGQERPAEDILLLLINHFDMQDQEAVQLWEMAGYNGSTNERDRTEEVIQEAMQGQKPIMFIVGMDARTMYSDTLSIATDQAGITMNFGKMNAKRQSQTVSSVGMSYDQALQVLNQLQFALLYGKHAHSPKQLPPASSNQA
jgi:transcriptional regulator with XRE-family HTH domain